jgi:DNA-binding beta-propeller fold protein YncE
MDHHIVSIFNKQGDFVRNIGQPGYGSNKEPGKLFSPYGVCLDKDGNIYVTNQSGNCVSVFDKSFNHVRDFGNDYLNYPCGITVSASGNIYVASSDANVVVVFGRTGNHKASIPLSSSTCMCAVDDEDNFFATGVSSARILIHRPGAQWCI